MRASAADNKCAAERFTSHPNPRPAEREDLHDPEGLVLRSPSTLVGRGRLARIDLGPAGRAIVRPLLRGGLLGKLRARFAKREVAPELPAPDPEAS